jgi:hypothetical protein
LAHRAVFGPIKQGLVLDHKCRTRCCVNPDHLTAVSHRENVLAGTAPPAELAKKTHCVDGHELLGENLYVTPKGARACKECGRRRWREWRSRK